MNPTKPVLIVTGVVVIGLICVTWTRHTANKIQEIQTAFPQIPAAAVVSDTSTNAPAVVLPHPKIKTRFSEFTGSEKAEFEANFKQRYKPALNKWCEAYDGHVPFSPDSVSTKSFVERVGKNASVYSEYVFVVDGITLGI